MPLGRPNRGPNSYGPPLTYLEKLQAASPTAFAKIEGLSKYTADEVFGGKLQDYQAQLLTPLSADIVANNKKLDLSKGVPEGATPITVYVGEASDQAIYEPGGYTKNIGTVNGVPVTAKYDVSGNLTGFQGDQGVRTWLDGKTSISGNWDASGNSAPQQYSSTGGGFIKGIVNDFTSTTLGNVIANIGAAYFGPLGSAALQLAKGNDIGDALKAAALTYAGQQAFGGLNANTSSISAADLAAANASSDPIAFLNASQGFTISDPTYLATIGATPAMIAANTPVPETVVATPIPEPVVIEQVLPPLAETVVATPIPEPVVIEQVLPPLAETKLPELLGEAGGNEFKVELEPLGSGPVPLGDAVTVEDITKSITGNADRAALNSNAGYGDTLTSDQITNYDKGILGAMGGGLTVGNALDYLRLGTVINALTGDPLKLTGDKPADNTIKPTGFDQIPIPTTWKSPTYDAAAAPIDLNSLFTDQNLLGGTQFQGLVNRQPNVSFNDIFASGMQRTPMGNPVNINQIVSSILGQNAASQKPT